jgi:hypothetical protein
MERAALAIWKPGAARWSRFGVGRDVTRPGPMYQIRQMIGASANRKDLTLSSSGCGRRDMHIF